jgi:hypothetical protein
MPWPPKVARLRNTYKKLIRLAKKSLFGDNGLILVTL